jgi:hypothetical protein
VESVVTLGGIRNKLIGGQSVSFDRITSTLTLTEEGRNALKNVATGQLKLSMPLRLYFGKTFIGNVPVMVVVGSYSISENADGTATLHTESPVPMSLDTSGACSPGLPG